jgi:hypothetical protein
MKSDCDSEIEQTQSDMPPLGGTRKKDEYEKKANTWTENPYPRKYSINMKMKMELSPREGPQNCSLAQKPPCDPARP